MVVVAEDIARAEGQGRAEAIAREIMRTEIAAAYCRGLDDAHDERSGGLFALLVGIVIGASSVGMVVAAYLA